MPTPLTFKGEKKSKSKKRKAPSSPSTDLVSSTQTLSTSTEPPADDSTWLPALHPSDLSGPIMLLLPTSPPSALSSDANGAVFALPVENIIEGNINSAEPHDVRMVWVCTRIAGEDVWSFKSGGGRYLGVGREGQVGALKEAVGMEEGFGVSVYRDEGLGEGKGGEEEEGNFVVKTGRGRYISAKEGKKGGMAGDWEVKGDKEEVDESCRVRIQMQARFKPREKEMKEAKMREKVSRKELQEMVGRKLEEDEVRLLKRARKEGDFREKILEARVRGKHDKFAS